ncbi:cation-dependent mannose-6-phosphate receptor [Calliopsis andreniformis]|uniref:cation-dependent mannose-6-phosphate receptor n=1 Tax=Calliopsis andreniformis TaxID=337506 RepID=UPI003FCD20A6
MLGENGRFVTFIVLFLMFFCDRTSSECAQLTPCSCIFSDGYGYDLSPLIDFRNLSVTFLDSNHTVYFHPCTNMRFFSNESSSCSEGSGVSLCLKTGNKATSLGTVEETTISVLSETPTLSLHHGTQISKVSLVCCRTCNVHLMAPSNKDDDLLLISPYCCKAQLSTKGLSTGSVLVILLFVFSGIYFIGGAIVLKLLRGATGWEMIPNHQFWRELPSYVRDGIVFVFNCGRDSYDRI